MRVALTGASGLVGRFLLSGLRSKGHEVVTLGRRGADLPFDLSETPPELVNVDALIHAGFAHIPGRYRGGEGDDPEGFRRRNVDGTLALLERARKDGVGRLIFLSSRAVYGGYPPGTLLREDMPPRPDTLYGQVKHEIEQALPDYAPHSASLRATGVYGPGARHKWEGLFADFLAGRPIAPRVATEVHGGDLAQAALIALSQDGHHVFNVSDLMLDRRALLSEVAAVTECPHALPAAADASLVSAMDCTALRALGWHPGGMERLRRDLPALLRSGDT